MESTNHVPVPGTSIYISYTIPVAIPWYELIIQYLGIRGVNAHTDRNTVLQTRSDRLVSGLLRLRINLTCIIGKVNPE